MKNTKIDIRVRDSADLEANRFLQIADGEDSQYLTYAVDAFPYYKSSTILEKGTDVTIRIKGSAVWEVEAGEDIKLSQAIYSGEDGKAFARQDKLAEVASYVGYAANDAEEGELVKVVRQTLVDGNWIKKVNDYLDSNTD